MGLLKEFSRIFIPDRVEKAIVDPVAALVGEDVNYAAGKSAVSAPAVSRQQAIETPTSGSVQTRPMEYMAAQTSATVPAPTQSYFPGFVSRLPQIARGVRDIAIGVGIGEAAEAVLDRSGQLKGVTRADQRKAKQMVELVGFDQAANILGISTSVLAMILTKKFRARGRGITAAQLRNAQRVNNRIVHMHKQLESSFKKSTAAARRRSTAASSRITQIKN